MTEIKDFDKKSHTAQWLLSNALTFIPDEDWAKRPIPDFSIIINGVVVDPNKFFDFVADEMDKEIKKQVNPLVADKIDSQFDAILNDLHDIRQELRSKLLKSLNLKEQDWMF